MPNDVAVRLVLQPMRHVLQHSHTPQHDPSFVPHSIVIVVVVMGDDDVVVASYESLGSS